jgi:uncharacterized protein (DUF885 family)
MATNLFYTKQFLTSFSNLFTTGKQILPDFRKYNGLSLWWRDLYTESLGKELGLYTDPYQYFGMLGNEMHRVRG